MIPKFLVDALVEQDAHQALADRSSWAFSRAAMAISRETEGNPSRNSSRVSPPSKYSNNVRRGTRVPRKTGVPPEDLGISDDDVIAGSHIRAPYHSSIRPVVEFRLCPAQIVLLQRQRTNALPCRGKHRVADRRSHPADNFLSDPGDGIVGGADEMDVNLGHVFRFQKRQRVKICLRHAALLDGDLLK